MRFWIPAGLLLFGLACVSSEDMDRLNHEVAALREDVQAQQKDLATKKDVQAVAAEVGTQTQKLVRSNAEMGIKMDDFSGQLETLQTQLKETNGRLSKLSQQISEAQKELTQAHATPPPASNPVPPAAGAETAPQAQPPSSPSPAPAVPPAPQSPSDLYKESYQDFLQGRYDIAVQGFQDFLKAAPDSDLVPDAWFYMGEALFSAKKFKEAVAAYEKLLGQHSKSDHAPAARLKKGLAYFELGNKTLGIVELQYCMYEYPDSEEA